MEGIDRSTSRGRLAPQDLADLRAAGTVRRYPVGDVLLREGDPSSVVFALLAGGVKVTKSSPDGRQVLLELRREGELVGELSAIDRSTRSATVEAMTEVEAAVVPGDRFRALLASRAGLSNHVLIGVVARLREASERQLELGTVDVVGRVCRRLCELAAADGRRTTEGIVVRSPLSQQELADWAGIPRDGVVRAFTELRRNGWLATGRQRIVILDPEAVRSRGGPDRGRRTGGGPSSRPRSAQDRRWPDTGSGSKGTPCRCSSSNATSPSSSR
ncbi:MAG: Crp/Fnr family transcriptional regulator [Acidimicrobiales bacterium]